MRYRLRISPKLWGTFMVFPALNLSFEASKSAVASRVVERRWVLFMLFFSCTFVENAYAQIWFTKGTKGSIANDIIPLEVGNQWDYEDTYEYDGRVVLENNGIKVFAHKEVQVLNKQEDSYWVNIWAGLDNSSGTTPMSFLQQGIDGIWEIGKRFYVGYGSPYPIFTDYAYAIKNYVIAYPADLGYKWSIKSVYKNIEQGVTVYDGERMICGLDQNVKISGLWYKSVAVCENQTGKLNSNLRVEPVLWDNSGQILPVKSKIQTNYLNQTYSVLFFVPKLGLVGGVKVRNGEIIWRRELKNMQIVVATEPESTLPSHVTLAQNYPNPFNPSTTIHFSLPSAGMVHLEVFDVLGRSVGVLANGVFAAGQHKVQFDAKNLPSGVYVVRLLQGSTMLTKSMNLVK
jgi:hypothetical protein